MDSSYFLFIFIIYFIYSSKHVRRTNFDYDHLVRTLDEREIFTPVNFEEERAMPHLDLKKFFERVNDIVGDKSALKEDSKTEEDSEYHPWKKEDVEKLTNLAMNDENTQSEFPSECK